MPTNSISTHGASAPCPIVETVRQTAGRREFRVANRFSNETEESPANGVINLKDGTVG
jgi:hypothetical protein